MNEQQIACSVEPKAGVKSAWSEIADAKAALADLASQLDTGRELAAVVLFISPEYRGYHLASLIEKYFGHTIVVGCTTAGEIGNYGYCEGSMVAVGLYADHFKASVCVLPKLSTISVEEVAQSVLQAKRVLLRSGAMSEVNEFGMLLVDGVSMQEDRVLTMLAPVLGQTPVFGGSAGDGMNFNATDVFFGGRFHDDSGVLLLVRSRAPIKVFQYCHFRPTGTRMVVTEAQSSDRVVRRINDEPAVEEYARHLGVKPDSLNASVFAANPVMLRLGNKNYVRSIKRTVAGGGLQLFSAIETGLVLTLGEPDDIIKHLASSLGALSDPIEPEFILAFDCILRRAEVTTAADRAAFAELFKKYNVKGFNTYGEQSNLVHINQTLTGVAFYPMSLDDDRG